MGEEVVVMEGVASTSSFHLLWPSSHRECSRGEDYRLIKLTIIDYNKNKKRDVVLECKGHDAARFRTVDHAHGWGRDVVGMVEEKHRKNKISVSFDCEMLKVEKAAEDHIKHFMPKLVGLDAVVNIGPMRIEGLTFEAEEGDVFRRSRLDDFDEPILVLILLKSEPKRSEHSGDTSWFQDLVEEVCVDIGPKSFPAATSVATLKESILAESRIDNKGTTKP